MDSYPWHQEATWEWARQHWRCNYLNVLKHLLQMVDVNIVRQTGRVEEVAVKCRLLDVHIPTWRADFVHICWWRASISTVLACRALLLPPLPFTCTVLEEGMFVSHSLVGGWPPKQHHFPVSICNPSACLCLLSSVWNGFSSRDELLVHGTSRIRWWCSAESKRSVAWLLSVQIAENLIGQAVHQVRKVHTQLVWDVLECRQQRLPAPRPLVFCVWRRERSEMLFGAALRRTTPFWRCACRQTSWQRNTRDTHWTLWVMAFRNHDVGRFNGKALFFENTCFRTTDRKQPLRVFHLKGRLSKWDSSFCYPMKTMLTSIWEMIDMHDSAEEGEDADKRVENNQKIFLLSRFYLLVCSSDGVEKEFWRFHRENYLCVTRDISMFCERKSVAVLCLVNKQNVFNKKQFVDESNMLSKTSASWPRAKTFSMLFCHLFVLFLWQGWRTTHLFTICQ